MPDQQRTMKVTDSVLPSPRAPPSSSPARARTVRRRQHRPGTAEDGAARAARRRRRSSSTSSPGPATPRTAPTTQTVDWVTPFEKETGCKVNVKLGNTSDEMVQLMRTGQYDGVSASGDATLRLIYAGDVAPVNTALVPNYATISSFLKDKPWNSVDGQMYGIPHGWGANLLMYNIDVVHDAPDSWGAVFDRRGQVQGQGDRLRLARSTSPTPRCTCRRPSRSWASRTRTR